MFVQEDLSLDPAIHYINYIYIYIFRSNVVFISKLFQLVLVHLLELPLVFVSRDVEDVSLDLFFSFVAVHLSNYIPFCWQRDIQYVSLEVPSCANIGLLMSHSSEMSSGVGSLSLEVHQIVKLSTNHLLFK